MNRVCNRQHGDEFPQEKIIAFCTQQQCEIKMACCHCYPDYHGDHVHKLVQIRDFHKFTAQDALAIRELRSSIEETRKKLISQAQEFCNSLLAKIGVNDYSNIQLNDINENLISEIIQRDSVSIKDSINLMSTVYQQLNSQSIIDSVIPMVESQIIQQSQSTQQTKNLKAEPASVIYQYQKPPTEQIQSSTQTTSRCISYVMGSVYYQRSPAINKPVAQQVVAAQNITQLVIQPAPGGWGGGHHGGGGHRGGHGHGHGHGHGPGGPKFRGGPLQQSNEPYEGRQMNPDGSSYRGLMKGGLRHGQGVSYYPDGSIEIGQFIEDLKEGEHQYAIMKIMHKRFYKNGQLINSIAI